MRECHGMAASAENRIWRGMKTRCYNPRAKSYAHYGGRGIRMCEEWRSSFTRFLADMGHRPSDKHSIDRIDVNGNYEPGNCRWATAKEQGNNMRTTRSLTINAVTHTLAEWSDMHGISRQTLRNRFNAGWPESQILRREIRNNSEVAVSLDDESLTLSDWAQRLNLSKRTLDTRLRRGWSVRRALTMGDYRKGRVAISAN